MIQRLRWRVAGWLTRVATDMRKRVDNSWHEQQRQELVERYGEDEVGDDHLHAGANLTRAWAHLLHALAEAIRP